MLTLYHGDRSTCSKRVRICLAEKGLDWQSVHLDLMKHENLDPEYLKLNPLGVVPTLDHDGKILIESIFINEYLDDCFPEIPLRPEDPFERAQMRIWTDRFEHVVYRHINTISFNKQGRYERFAALSPAAFQEMLDRQATVAKRARLAQRMRDGVSNDDMAFAEARIAEVLDDMEAALQDRPWLTGETFSLAECAVAPFIDRMEENGLTALVDWTARPALGDWWDRLRARESFKTAFAFKAP